MIYAPVSLGLLSRLMVCKFDARPPHPKDLVTFEELFRAMMYETEATRRVLVRKGLLTNEEVLQELKAGKNWGGQSPEWKAKSGSR